ncbi:MAG: chromosomal replication initiator protein DnaA [Candidatus Liptonbacteria bacterium]|nr:chromosomal replication initiator protein DnaA [Candidatus Liptonbacteria bacterium]
MDLENLWRLVLGEMEQKTSRANFATWLKGSCFLDRRDGVGCVGLPNNFAKEWVQNKYHKDLLGIIRIFDDSVKKLEFVVISEAAEEAHKRAAAAGERTSPNQSQISLEFRVDPETNLNSRYTLNSFVVGSSNELAHAAASAVVQDVGTKYNPFFVYGGVGLGKTHLIQAVGNEILLRYHGTVRPKYVTSERFTNDVVWAIRNKRMEDIKKKYRDVDVLIIDDIQFIGGKEKTEEEFFHTFNALYEHNKQIIISSDRPPQSIPTLEERLRSRFEGGLIVDISYPEYETRVAIIKSKLQQGGRLLSDEVVDLIARRVKKNIRELEGILNKIVFYQDKKQTDISRKVAEEIIDKSIQAFSRPVSDAQVIGAVADFYNIPTTDLIGRCRRKEIVEPRQVTMFLLRDILGLSYPYIGEKMGRDHTTAIHSFEKITVELTKNSNLNQKMFQIRELINKS